MAVLDPVQARARQLGRGVRQRGASRRLRRARASASPRARQARASSSAREVWIERDDFADVPPKGFFRLFPGNQVRLKYGYVVECTGCETRRRRQLVTAVLARLVPDTKSGTPGADAVKVKGTITWVARRCAERRGAPLRSPVRRRAAGRRRQGLQGQPQPGQQARRRAACSSRRSPAPPPNSASSSSGTATSSPIASITAPGNRSSIASRHCATPGPSKERTQPP